MSDTMLTALMVIEVIIAVTVSILILLQNRSDGLGSMFGGSGGGEVFRTKRGLEKTLHRVTILLVILLSAISMILVKYSA